MATKNVAKREADDPAMVLVRALWIKHRATGWTLERLGVAMGASQQSARQAAYQFLKGHDPRIGTLRKFAKAIGVSMADIIRVSGFIGHRNYMTESEARQRVFGDEQGPSTGDCLKAAAQAMKPD